MLTRQAILADTITFRDKARGVLSGLAIGDSFGDASRHPDNQMAYGFTADFNKGASWSTDDTEFAMLTAHILLGCQGELTSEDVVDAWLQHVCTHDELKRGGASEHEASINLRRGLRPPLTGRYNAYSHSDGAAMRIAPIGILCAGNVQAAKAMAKIDAEISHDREGIWGAQAVAAAVAAAMADASMDEIWAAAMSAIPEDTWFRYAMETADTIIREANGDFLSAWMPLHDRLWTSYKAAVSEAVVQAFAVLRLMHDDFRKGVILAGNFGRDADTIGAICGAVLGARYGAKGIPAKWIDKTRFPTGTCLAFTKGLDVLDVADRLADIALSGKMSL